MYNLVMSTYAQHENDQSVMNVRTLSTVQPLLLHNWPTDWASLITYHILWSPKKHRKRYTD